MKAIELKINNWVTINDPDWANLKGLPFKVIGINPLLESNKPSDDYVITVCDFYGTYKIYNEFIEPIPLTPEILVKAGFEIDVVSTHDYKRYDLFTTETCYLIGDFHAYFELTSTSNDKDGNTCFNHKAVPNIKYLHKLQNLYLYLTGEELPIEL
jgi:hypothetical protein